MKNKNISCFSLTMSRVPFWVLKGEWIHIFGRYYDNRWDILPDVPAMNYRFKKDMIASFVYSKPKRMNFRSQTENFYGIYLMINSVKIMITIDESQVSTFKEDLDGLVKLIGCQ